MLHGSKYIVLVPKWAPKMAMPLTMSYMIVWAQLMKNTDQVNGFYQVKRHLNSVFLKSLPKLASVREAIAFLICSLQSTKYLTKGHLVPD